MANWCDKQIDLCDLVGSLMNVLLLSGAKILVEWCVYLRSRFSLWKLLSKRCSLLLQSSLVFHIVCTRGELGLTYIISINSSKNIKMRCWNLQKMINTLTCERYCVSRLLRTQSFLSNELSHQKADIRYCCAKKLWMINPLTPHMLLTSSLIYQRNTNLPHLFHIIIEI